MRYWNTSALAKLYFDESDSKLFRDYLMRTGLPISSELIRWEMFRVAARKEAEGLIGEDTAETAFAKFIADVSARKVTLVPFDETVENRFRDLVLRLHRLKQPIFGRTLDCIHIATAELLHAEEIVVTDIGLRKAACAIGLKVFPN